MIRDGVAKIEPSQFKIRRCRKCGEQLENYEIRICDDCEIENADIENEQ